MKAVFFRAIFQENKLFSHMIYLTVSTEKYNTQKTTNILFSVRLHWMF